MKISKFVAQISTGLARSNKFLVSLTPPSSALTGLMAQGKVSYDNSQLQKILLLCDSAQLPGLTVNTTPIRSFGEVREIPYEQNYEPITLSFFVDSGMNVKKLFDNWLLATQINDTRKFNYYDSYTSPMTIYVQDMAEKSRYFVEMFEAYPKTVSAVQLDYANKDVMKIQVTMMYKYWRSTQIETTTSTKKRDTEMFDYTTQVNKEQYLNDFPGFQQDYNARYGTPEGLGNATGETLIYT